MPAYQLDPGLEKLGKEVIEKHKPLLTQLKIGYMFQPEAGVRDGKTIAGMCVRLDDRNRAIHGHDFVIVIAKDVWDAIPDEKFRYALMHHELCHIGVKQDPPGKVKFNDSTQRPDAYVKPHDIEEFDEVMEVHGTYHAGLRSFLNAHARNKEKKKAKPITAKGKETKDYKPS